MTPLANDKPVQSTRRARASSDVTLWRSFGLAAAIYGLLVAAAAAMSGPIRVLLLERGWVQHAILGFFSWSMAILVCKALALRAQRRAFALSLLPSGEHVIAQADAARLVEHVESLRHHPALPRRGSFLVDRLQRILEHHAARGDVAETTAQSTADAEADSMAVAASFSLVRVLIWAMPILGFIGTVLGLGSAVGGFAESLAQAQELDQIKTSLGVVTSGLSLAFDNTLVALCASLLVMLPTSWLQKSEDKLIADVDEYCATRVLRRLHGAAEPAAATPIGDDLPRLIVAALAGPIAEMLSSSTRLMDRFDREHERLGAAHGQIHEQLAAFAGAARLLGPGIERAVAGLDRAVDVADRAVDTMGRSQDQLKAVQEQTSRAQQGMVRVEEQLCRELGASRQLLSLLAAGMGNGHDGGNGARAAGSNGAHVELEE